MALDVRPVLGVAWGASSGCRVGALKACARGSGDRMVERSRRRRAEAAGQCNYALKMVRRAMHSLTTRDVMVSVNARPCPERSHPTRRMWFFLYTIRIFNNGDAAVQLLTRHWVITDAEGEVEEVTGDGVVGQTPRLEPGESFEYTSGCPLPTPFGSMHGSYGMVDEKGEPFDVEVPGFALRDPRMMQ